MLAPRDGATRICERVRELGVPVFVADDDAGLRAARRGARRAPRWSSTRCSALGAAVRSTGALGEILRARCTARARARCAAASHRRRPADRRRCRFRSRGPARRDGRHDGHVRAREGRASTRCPARSTPASVQVIDIGLPKEAERDVTRRAARHDVGARALAAAAARCATKARSDACSSSQARRTTSARRGSPPRRVPRRRRPRHDRLRRARAGSRRAGATRGDVPASAERDRVRRAVIDALAGYDVLLIGPGLGQSGETRAARRWTF